ncbi:hypothetical protein I5907_19685 [Panacibacter sp. DH6]|uniref:DUF4412 domain-containing protein n=1 Tax=Panacibacter microcysteis TaxID=2793269 RepID=A0A931H040_9BACT|nr:hypothetical protein [Panacibacter microcysteis]MBG9378468.1 hypothetical protein [Panacibacter microcysteis]
MKKNLLLLLFLALAIFSTAQGTVVVGDCTVTFNIHGEDAGTNKNLSGATKTLYVKGKLARTDIESTGFKQTIIYDNKAGSAVVLKEVGPDKYKTVYTPEKWNSENKKYEGMKITPTTEKKTILGYECKKIIATLKDGTSYSMYYTTAIMPSANENPFQFKDIQGFVLEYETSMGAGKSKIVYTATVINFNPVPASKFEIPSAGYRLLQ